MSAAAPVRVQDIAAGDRLPLEYIQPPSLRRDAQQRKNPASVPIVDLSSADSSVSSAIRSACVEWGCFHLTNHGVPVQLLRSVRSLGLQFFRSSAADRMRFACDAAAPASEGYGSRMLATPDAGVLDWRDYFDHHTLPIRRRDPSRWPDFIPGYRETILEYSDHMKELAQQLLRIISSTLNLPPMQIETSIGEIYQNITISYYSPCPQPDLALGLQSHSDFGAITLLIQDDVGGLEVLKDGEWVSVQPMPDAILAILADQTEIISNGEYKSAVHRAIVNADHARLSVATFHDPSKSTKIQPAEKLISKIRPAKFRPILYGDYVSSWYNKGPDGKRNIEALLI